MPSIRNELDEALYEITMFHLGKLRDYVPGPVKEAGGSKKALRRRYHQDPVYSIFGLDSPEYIAATLGGGTVTSIHRKIGDIYESVVKRVVMATLGLTEEQVTYEASIQSGDVEEHRTADVSIPLDDLDGPDRERIAGYCQDELRKLTDRPRADLVGLGMEVRHSYATGDSKRTQADEAMARHLLVSGILPIMPLFSDQSNRGIVRRYRSVWVVKEGMESYEMVTFLTRYDLFDFMRRNREDFRQPVIQVLKGLYS
ncbi:MAG TPA: hypothetical protein VM031_02700 [Phycisphaerae bacterium]|nr:hypothetical protein [Phycisphaerae bacterium]